MIETAVGSNRVIIVANELLEKLAEVTLIERDDMIEKLASQYSDYPLGEWILLRLPVCCPYRLDADIDQEMLEVCTAEYRIVIVNEVFRLLSKRHCFSYLLECPSCGRMCGHCEVLDLSALTADDYKHIKNAESDGGHGGKIDCPSIMHVV
jgi:hypothetical protein